MYLNNEKLQLASIVSKWRQRRLMKKRRKIETRRTKKVTSMVDKRLGRWVAAGKYKLNYNSIDEILQELDVTRDELSYFCATRFGKSFLTWRKELRIEEAKHMLLDYPSLPAYRIGQALGISDKSDFRHQFKSATGVTPTEWREKYLKKNLRK